MIFWPVEIEAPADRMANYRASRDHAFSTLVIQFRAACAIGQSGRGRHVELGAVDQRKVEVFKIAHRGDKSPLRLLQARRSHRGLSARPYRRKHVDEWLWAYFLSLHFGARGSHAMLRFAFRKAIACSQFGQNQTRSRWVVFNLGAQLADEDA